MTVDRIIMSDAIDGRLLLDRVRSWVYIVF